MSAGTSFAKGFFHGFFTVLAYVSLGIIVVAIILLATGKLKIELK